MVCVSPFLTVIVVHILLGLRTLLNLALQHPHVGAILHQSLRPRPLNDIVLQYVGLPFSTVMISYRAWLRFPSVVSHGV